MNERLPAHGSRVDGPRRAPAWTVALAALAFAAPVAAKEVVKVATLAPQGSVWDNGLREMGARWAKESGGRVELRIYPGGVAGDEADVVRKIRIGQFQGAALTVSGLAELDPSFRVFHLPLLVASWSELDFVLQRLRPEFERRLEAKGYYLLSWGHGGWVHLFSRQPIRVLDDLKRQKLFVWAGDDAVVQQWRKNGYQPVPLAATDVTMGFQTKMIDVVPTTPIAALTLQWFRQATFMTELGLAPLVGGVVLTRPAWDSAAAGDRPALLDAARALEELLEREVPKRDAAAIEEMKGRGLQVVAVTPEQRAAWLAAAGDFVRESREADVPPDVLKAAREAIAEYRTGPGAGR